MSAVIASQSFGLVTVMVPLTFQSLSMKPVSVAVTVYVAVPPASSNVLSTFLLIVQL